MAKKLRKKSRAPDLLCVLGNQTVVVVEVTVSVNPEQARKQKEDKYKDLVELLPLSTVVQEHGWNVHPKPIVIVMDESSLFPEETKQDLQALAALSSSTSFTQDDSRSSQEAQRFITLLQGKLSTS